MFNYTIKPFDPKKPAFAPEEQRSVIAAHQQEIEEISKIKDVQDWNLYRHTIRTSMKGAVREYCMLMGYIDNILFPYVFNLKKR